MNLYTPTNLDLGNTTHAIPHLQHLVDIFYKNINKNEFTGVLFVDFAKAFDVIDHDLLLRKLTLYGLSNDTLHLISSFLSKSRTACLYKPQLNPIFFP